MKNKSFRSANNGKLPSIKECIEVIEQSYGGCTFLGSHITDGHRVYVFDVPKSIWSPTTYFTTEELRFTYIYGWYHHLFA